MSLFLIYCALMAEMPVGRDKYDNLWGERKFKELNE